ncbi:hypothetical protein BDW22DRAFT_1426940 [Trametopsis cervina]|nr:hypothetical protein BDW22DRAFT_1426940 [Trametopsis cervina]
MKTSEIADRLLNPKVDLKLEDDEDLRFFIGIRPCGASYLLLSQRVVDSNAYLRNMFEGRAWSSDRFISLSPVSFANAAALTAKLATLANNKPKKSGQEFRDRSQANVSFTTGSDPDTLQPVGIDRAIFEYHRILYRLWQGSIDPTDYEAARVPWFNDVDTMWSFAFNTWAADRRRLEERQNDPKILDISWTRYAPPSSSEGIYSFKTTHVLVHENRMLANSNRIAFLHGESDVLSHQEISKHLQIVFDEAKRTNPVLLLVHDVKWTLLVLKFFGVDTTEWCMGVEPVLGRQILKVPPAQDSYSGYEGRSSNRYQDVQRYKSERSRSPRRGGPSGGRNRSPPMQAKSPYPVYLVDVKSMYAAMKQVSEFGDASVPAIAHALHVNYERPGREAQIIGGYASRGWCAGNESRILGYIWDTMASGNAIDEQRVARFSRIVQQTHEQADKGKEALPKPPAGPPPPIPAPPADGGESDSDRDPNDMVPGRQPVSTNVPATMVSDPYGSDDEDYIDF